MLYDYILGDSIANVGLFLGLGYLMIHRCGI